MKTVGIILTVIASVFLISSGCVKIIGHYQYEKKIASYWSLADKSSTIEKKSEYIDKLVDALGDLKYQGKHNAIFLTTPDNGFDENYDALKSLQIRLQEIKLMDITSFEYQTAIQQITGQEQGEAMAMLNVFEGIWWKTNYIFLWHWIFIVQILLNIIMLGVGLAIWGSEADW